jgi:hypothetical protein
LSPEESCAYRGIAFDTYYRGFNALLPILLGPILAAIGVNAQPKPGDYIRVWLPTPLGVDFSLCSLTEIRLEKDGLDAYFSINATDVDLARRCLAGSITAALLRLGEAYHLVQMYCTADGTQYIEFGPLDRRPEETAADLSTLVEALVSRTSCEVVDATLVSPGNAVEE